MTWLELKTLVKDQIQFDGASSASLSDITLNGAFDKTAFYLLNLFVRMTYSLYADRSSLTTAAGQNVYDLLDATVCAKPIFMPVQVWLNGSLRSEISFSEMRSNLEGYAEIPTATPQTWAMLTEGTLYLGALCEGVYDDCFVSGFQLHPAFSSDDDQLQLAGHDTLALTYFMSVLFAEPVVDSQIAMARMAQRNPMAAEGMRRLAARNKRDFYGGSCPR